jgi:hypothetical protein
MARRQRLWGDGFSFFVEANADQNVSAISAPISL